MSQKTLTFVPQQDILAEMKAIQDSSDIKPTMTSIVNTLLRKGLDAQKEVSL